MTTALRVVEQRRKQLHGLTLDEVRGRLTLTVPEAAELLSLGRGAAYAAARRGEIPTLRMGNRLLVPVPRLLELLGYTP